MKMVQPALLLLLRPPLGPPTSQQPILAGVLSTLSGETLLNELLFVPLSKDKDGQEEMLSLSDVNEAEKLLWGLVSVTD